MAKALFWFAAALLFYTLLGYPLLLWLLSRHYVWPHLRAPIRPRVSLIVTAHNEEARIATKIGNCLALDYPKNKLEIIVASDGSTDATAAIARGFDNQGLRVIELQERRGKQYAQREAKNAATGEIVVFTDAAVQLAPNALREIVSNFVDPAVGCVSSEDELGQSHRGWVGERIYVQFEMWLRRMESRMGSVVTVSGSFFAVRRSVCDEWHVDQTSDFFLPLNAISMGMRAVVDPASVGRFGEAPTQKAEMRRKLRTIVNGLHVFFSHRELLNPFRSGPVAWQLISHKLFRWLAPFAFLTIFVSSMFLVNAGFVYALAFALQTSLYVLGAMALAVERARRWKPVKLAGYFLLVNVATAMAWLSYLSGERFVTWQPTERN